MCEISYYKLYRNKEVEVRKIDNYEKIVYAFCEHHCYKYDIISINCAELYLCREDIFTGFNDKPYYVDNIKGSAVKLTISFNNISMDLNTFSYKLGIKKLCICSLFVALKPKKSYKYNEVEFCNNVKLKDIFAIKSKFYCGYINADIWSLIKCPQVISFVGKNNCYDLIKARKKILFLIMILKSLKLCKLTRHKIITELIKLKSPELF